MTTRTITALVVALPLIAGTLAAQTGIAPHPEPRAIPTPDSSPARDSRPAPVPRAIRERDFDDLDMDRAGDLRDRLTDRAAELRANIVERSAELNQRMTERSERLQRTLADRSADRAADRAAEAADRAAEANERANERIGDRISDRINDRINDRMSDRMSDLGFDAPRVLFDGRAAERVADAQDRMNDLRLEMQSRAADRIRDLPIAPAPRALLERDDRSAAARFATLPPEASAQGDQADSLYRAARETLVRGDYRRAAQLFRDVGDRFPKSTYAPDALYWQAFALYRIGANQELRQAVAALEAQRARYPQAATQATDAAALAARIRGALASRGDAAAAAHLEKDASQSGAPCDKEDQAVRVEALSALGQMDPTATMPILKRVLARRDECSAGLRRRAIFLLGRRADSASADLLAEAARSEPDRSARNESIMWLARMPGDKSVTLLEELLKSDDESVQQSAVQALASSESPRARVVLRSVVERAGVSERIRSEALGSFEREHATADDAAWLRAVYSKLESRRLKSRAVNSIARIGGPENEQWLLALAKRGDEPIELRSEALQRMAQAAPVADVAKLYDAMGERPLKEQILSSLARRKEPEATDKLLEIAKTGTDPELRREAIAVLTRKNDPRTIKLLLEILDK